MFARLRKLYSIGAERLRAVADALKTRAELDAMYTAEIAAANARSSAAERRMDSMAREGAAYRRAYRLIVNSVLRGGAAQETMGCRVCKREDGHEETCEIGAAHKAMLAAALMQAECDPEGEA